MYESLSTALARAQERAGTSGDDEYLTEVLTLSAGVDGDGATQYRPYYAAAKFLEQNRSAQTLSAAGDVKFTGLAKPIESLLGLQASIDKALGLIIPEGFEAILPGCQSCDNQKSGSVHRFSSGAVSVRAMP